MAEEQLLKVWDNWEDGVGYLRDTGERNGMYYASSILGLSSELRPAPFSNAVTVDIPAAHHFQYYLEEPESSASTLTEGNVSTGSGTDDVTVSHTVANNPNRLLVVLVASSDNNNVTFGGTNMTNLKQRADSGAGTVFAEIWYMVAPPVSTANVVTDNPSFSDTTVCVIDFYGVDQSTPFGNFLFTDSSGATSSTLTVITSTGEIIVDILAIDAAPTPPTTVAAGANQTEKMDISFTSGTADLHGAASTQSGADGGVMSWTWTTSDDHAHIAVPILPAGRISGATSYLYAMRGRRSSGDTAKLHKINLSNDSFAAVETSTGDDFHDLTPLEIPGQPARYQGKWYLPGGNDSVALELSVIGIGSNSIDQDTVTATATGHEEGADHLANLNFQLVGVVKDGTNAGGVRILKKDGTATTEADWGADFEVGDNNERAGGLRSLGGAVFVINPEGIFSFNVSGKSGLVFEDFRIWKSSFVNISMQPWNGGLIIPHPSGLLFYSLGRRPISIGVDSKRDLFMIPPSGPTELHGGRHHGTHPVGDFLYAIHQPDVSSTTVNIMCGYSLRNNPFDITWQILGTTTLQDNDHMLGLFVAIQGRPLASTHVTPTLWFGNGDDLNYIVLDSRGSPFRSRTDTHKLVTSGDVYMSEIMFDIPRKLTKVVIHTKDMAANDEWQISGIADNGSDVTFGKTVIENGRAERTINQHDVYKFMLHIKWIATSTSDRVPPTITRIELYGTQ